MDGLKTMVVSSGTLLYGSGFRASVFVVLGSDCVERCINRSDK